MPGIAARLPLGVTGVMLPELDFSEQIKLCSALGVTHYVFRPREIPAAKRGGPFENWGNHAFDLTPQRFAKEGSELARQLRDAGLRPWCSVPAASADAPHDPLEEHLVGCAQAGCASIRLSPPSYPKGLFDYEAYLASTIAAYQRAVEMARAFALKVVIEMHAGTLATSPGLAYALARQFEPEQLGLVPDLANFAREGAVRPNLGIAVVSRWIDHLHVGGSRRTEGEPDALGWRRVGHRFCALSESDLDVPGWLSAVAQLPREIPLVIEDYSPDMTGEARLRRAVQELRTLLDHLESQEQPRE